MAKSFTKTEKKILSLIDIGTTFNYKDGNYEVVSSGKPIPLDKKGECKTDIYLKAKSNLGINKEFKISIKQHNADFIENKTDLMRATNLFGKDAQTIIAEAIRKIEDKFLDHPVIYFAKKGKTESNCLTLGWRFELFNKQCGKKSGIIELTKDQKLDVYAGTNLNIEKKNGKVNGEIIMDSGIANYILTVNPNSIDNFDALINKIEPLEEYVEDANIFFACKAVNYRASKNKWEGNRSLAVVVDWKIKEKFLKADFIFENPLSTKANDVGKNVKQIMKDLKIEPKRFNKLEDVLHPSVNKYVQKDS